MSGEHPSPSAPDGDAPRDGPAEHASTPTARSVVDAIGTAKGRIMQRHRVDEDTAFDLLLRAARETDRELPDLARRFLGPDGPAGPHPDPDPDINR